MARAAARLHVTPSAVSNALARLREALDDPLVTRKRPGSVPTPRALAPRIARAMAELELALVDTPFDAARCRRTFTIAVADLGQITWIPKLAQAVQRELPRSVVRVVGIDALVALGDLSASEVDVHVGMASSGPGLHSEPLGEERSVLVARARHPATHARAAKLTKTALAKLSHVQVEMVPGKNFRDPFAALFTRAGGTREVVMTVPSFSAAAEVVAASDLVTMLPTSLLEAKGPQLRLAALATALPTHAVQVAMCWHERTHVDQAARVFRELVRRCATRRGRRA